MDGYNLLALILFAIGMFFEIVNIGVFFANRKGGSSSGVPFFAGIFFCLALAAFSPTRHFWFVGMLFDVTLYSTIDTFILIRRAYKKNDEFRITVLADNKECGEYKGEHGLSLYIEYGIDKILVDTGCGELFFENAEKMGIDLSQVTHAVLSHSHYDHSDGFEKFFEVNKKAKLYVRKEAGECYYSMHDDGMKYIGPKKGMLEKYKDRIVFVDREYESIGTWAWNMILLSHTTEGLSKIGEKAKLYKEENGELIPDDFAHEQTLCIGSPKGIIIINSCSHGGAANIIKEVERYYEGYTVERNIYAYIGGFHLFKSSDEDIMEFANTLKEVDCQRIITGHCTGEHAFEILKQELGDKVEQMHSGMVIDILSF